MSQLIDQLRDEIRVRHYSIRTEQSYSDWVRQYVQFHNLRHPSEMGAPEITRFLTHLAVDRNVAASTQNHRVKGFAPRGCLQGRQPCSSSMFCTR